MVMTDFWDNVKSYIDAKTTNLGLSLKNVLDQYPWDAFEDWKNAGFPAAKGWKAAGTGYDPITTKVTFASDQGLGFVTGPLKGDQGSDGIPGVSMNILGVKDTADVILLQAASIGDAYVASSVGTDSNNVAVAIGDVLRAIDTNTPSTWVRLPPITGPVGPVGPVGPEGPAPVQSGYAGRFLATDGDDNTEPTWEVAITPTDFPTPTEAGVSKYRLDGNDLYISATVNDA